MSDEYICSRCGGIFEKGWSDEEAIKESDEYFPDHSEEWAVICDDCFKIIFNQ